MGSGKEIVAGEDLAPNEIVRTERVEVAHKGNVMELTDRITLRLPVGLPS